MIEAYSSDVLWILIVGFIMAFILAFGIGANDVANSFGTSVGSKVLTIRQACYLATVFEIAGSILIGYKVSDTMRKGILEVNVYEDDEKELMLGMFAALIASSILLLGATFLRLPVSGTHSIVGATIGFSLVCRGARGLNWLTLGTIVGSWFVSPVMSGLISVVLFVSIRRLILRSSTPMVPGLICLPIFYGVTILINVFSIVHDGSSLLYFDHIPWWGALLISLGVGALVGILVQIFVVPRMKNNTQDTANLSSNDMNIKNDKVKQTENAEKEVTNGNVVNAKEVTAGQDNPAFTPSSEDTTAKRPSDMKKVVDDDPPEVRRLFSFLQILTASFGSFAHGGNDVSNAIGPLIALWMIFSEGSVKQKSETPLYILLYGGVGIVVGLWVWGRRVIKTIGEDLAKITPSTGFTIEIGAAFTVLLASKIGLPISTTHCKVGSVVFVGWASSTKQGVDWKLFRNIIGAWVVTVPLAAALSAAAIAILREVAL